MKTLFVTSGALPPICVALTRYNVDSTLKSLHLTHFGCVMVLDNSSLRCEQVLEQHAFFDCLLASPRLVSRVAMSDSHMLIIADGQLFSVGCNSKQQLGLPSSVASTKQFALVESFAREVIVDCAVGDEHSVVCLRSDGRCIAFGANDDGQCGVGAPSHTANGVCATSGPVERVACGPNTSYMIAYDGSVHACGFNSHGELVCVCVCMCVCIFMNVGCL